MQTEFSVYVLLRLWLYLKFHQGWEGNPQDAVLKSHKYFQVSHQVQFELKVMSDVFLKKSSDTICTFILYWECFWYFVVFSWINFRTG